MKHKKKVFPVVQAYQFLEPGPVVLVTSSRKGKPNIMTMAWQMPIEFVPQQVACMISNQNYSFASIKQSKECVLNIPAAELAKTIVRIGNCSGSKTDKFKKFGLTQVPATEVDVPMIAECFANIECKVVDMQLVAKYNIFILEVVKAWITTSKKRQRMLHHCGNGVFTVDGKIINLPSKKTSLYT